MHNIVLDHRILNDPVPSASQVAIELNTILVIAVTYVPPDYGGIMGDLRVRHIDTVLIHRSITGIVQ